MNNLFNSKVSIITKAEIRYEGMLFQINPQQQTLALKDVRSFGTEGRRPDHEIPPNIQSYDIIVFKAQEIKELKTVEEEPQPTTDVKQPIIQQQQQSYPEQSTQQVQQQQQPQNYQQRNPYYKKQSQESRRFDFDEMFDKMQEIEKIKKQETLPKYNKTSFFDNLSTNNQKQDRSGYNRNQNQIDTDTFGTFYKQKQQYQKFRPNRQQGQQREQIVYVEKTQAKQQQ